MVNFTILAGGFSTFIASYVFDSDAGSLRLAGQTPTGPNPSWIASHPTNKSILYAVNENSPQGALQSFRLNGNGGLSLVDTVQVEGQGTTFTNPLSTGEVSAVNFGSPNCALVATDPSNPLLFSKTSPTLEFPVNGGPSNPHQSLEFNDEVFVPDLGADTVWRLVREENASPGAFKVHGRIDVQKGNGPRHIAIQDNTLFILHELTSSLTAHSIPPPSLTPAIIPPLANVSIIPSDQPANSTFRAAEIVIFQPTTNFLAPLIYVSNRNLGPDFDPRGDSIAIFEFISDNVPTSTISRTSAAPSPNATLTHRDRVHPRQFGRLYDVASQDGGSISTAVVPTTTATVSGTQPTTPAGSFKLHSQVFTSLRQIRSFAIGSSTIEGSEEFLIAGGSLDGGVAVFRRVDEGRDLELVAKNEELESRTSFVWV